MLLPDSQGFLSHIKPLRGVLPLPGSREATQPILFVQLGRFGDICNVLPIARVLVHFGYVIDFLVSEEFSSILSGIRYVQPRIFQGAFTEHGRAIREHGSEYQTIINTQVWGEDLSVERREPSYNRESWRVCGAAVYFNHPEFRLSFDNRSPEREEALFQRLGGDERPCIAVAVTGGVTAQFTKGQLVLDVLRSALSPDVALLDLCSVQAERIFDFLGVYDRSTILVSSDTVHLHLSDASSVPLFGFLNSVEGIPWGTSRVRSPNLIGSALYRDADKGVHALLNELEKRSLLST